MTQQDLLVTPIWFIILSVAAYLIRPYVTDSNTRKYFMPALLIRFVAAILLGVLYQFYYGGGDTFSYHTHGSSHIYAAFQDSMVKGLNLLFASGKYIPGTFEYASQIWFYRDPSSYFIIKIAALFDLLTFNTYSATALFFAAFSFSGLWALFLVLYNSQKKIHLYLALAVLFVPSVIFWGSGILKDTITLGAVGWSIYAFHRVFIKSKFSLFILLVLVLNLYIIYHVKVYIVLTLIPAMLLWWILTSLKRIRSVVLKMIIFPAIVGLGVFLIYLMLEQIAVFNPKYALENIGETAKITAYDIGFYTGRNAGSGYSLGELDGSLQSLIVLFPEGVAVSLFRPFIWEVNNPLMLLSALESIVITVLTIFMFASALLTMDFSRFRYPLVLFLLSFSIVFAFAVGVSTFNFGTLARYKIPMLPLYCSALFIIIKGYSQKAVKKNSGSPELNTY